MKKNIILLIIISLTSCANKISDAKISSKENEIKLCAEVPEIMKGDGYGAFYNMCPEVHLFDAQNSFSYFHNIL